MSADRDDVPPAGTDAPTRGDGTPAEQVELSVVSSRLALATLKERFGALVDADYLPGKTLFRDALLERFQLSELQAEELCDDLERAEWIRFIQTPEGCGWHVHALSTDLGDAS